MGKRERAAIVPLESLVRFPVPFHGDSKIFVAMFNSRAEKTPPAPLDKIISGDESARPHARENSKFSRPANF
jgi:hypothetical protein